MKNKVYFLSYGLCLGLSILLVFLLGYPLRLDRVLLTYFSLIFLARFIIFRVFFCINFIIADLYFPISFYYGSPNIAVFSTLSEINIDEFKELCLQLPTYFYAIQLLLLIIFILIFKKLKFPRITNYYLIIFALLLCAYRPIKAIIKYNPNSFDSISTIIINYIKYPFLEFYIDFYKSGKIYLAEKQEQLNQLQKTNTIPIIDVIPKHKTYMIILGESVRKDYMSAYGFKYNNTPFVNKNASIIWNGLISPASYIQASIPYFMSQSVFLENNTVNIQLNNNIVSIANEAGFETYWLSNQGKAGEIQITVPRIASYAQHAFYTKKEEFNDKSSQGKYDTLLLPELNNILSIQHDKPKLIVMHLMGSHPHFCRRLQFEVQFDLNNNNISCYVSSIKETDDLLSSIIDLLKKHKQDYSAVYFADHGLAHIDQYQDLRHNSEYQNSYQVPLIFFNSDHTSQQLINKQISGYQFVYLLSHWMGINLDIEHDYMQQELYNIPEQTDIKVKDWYNNNLFQYDKLKRDLHPF